MGISLKRYALENKIKRFVCLIRGHKWRKVKGYSMLAERYTGETYDVCDRCGKGEHLQG